VFQTALIVLKKAQSKKLQRSWSDIATIRRLKSSETYCFGIRMKPHEEAAEQVFQHNRPHARHSNSYDGCQKKPTSLGALQQTIFGTLLTLPAVLVSDCWCQNLTFPAELHA